ncbi:MAG: hypothetical protein ACI9FZ_001208, partial [Bacteroidia bacterium]
QITTKNHHANLIFSLQNLKKTNVETPLTAAAYSLNSSF